MRKLFLTGNGFDLQHGLRTSYSDLAQWLHLKAGLEDPTLPEHRCAPGPWNEFYILTYERISTRDLTELICYIAHDGDDDRLWSDIEARFGKFSIEEIKEFAPEFVDSEGWSNPFERDYHIIQNSIHWPNIIEQFRESVIEWLATIERSHPRRNRHFARLFRDEEIMFASFNYTNTLQRLYDIPHSRVTHLHGSVAEGRIDFGHTTKHAPSSEDDYFDDAYGALFDALRKPTSPHQLEALLAMPISHIIFYGFSFNPVDEIYLATLANRAQNDCKWIVLHRPNLELDQGFMDASNQMMSKFNIGLRHIQLDRWEYASN